MSIIHKNALYVAGIFGEVMRNMALTLKSFRLRRILEALNGVKSYYSYRGMGIPHPTACYVKLFYLT